MLHFCVAYISCLKESPVEVILEIPVFDTEGRIGPAGGVVRIMDENDPLYGSYVAIKEDALDDFVNIKIERTSSPDPALSDSDRIFIRFLPAGTQFRKPAEIGIVYGEGCPDSLQPFVYEPELEEWFPLPFRRLDRDKKLVVGLIPHFSILKASSKMKRDIAFPDPNLEFAVRERIGFNTNLRITFADAHDIIREGIDLYENEKDTLVDAYYINIDGMGIDEGDRITLGDVYYIGGLDAAKYGIEDLTGLEYFRFLRLLDISENSITSLEPLSNNRNLTILAANDNEISDLTPLSGLRHLRVLALDDNEISDVTPLGTLSNLSGLGLSHNAIADIRPLAVLTQLENVVLFKNQIQDISIVSGLINLKGLLIDHNRITTIPSLNRLDSLTSIDLSNNLITNPFNLSSAKNLQSIVIDSCAISHFPNLPGLDSLKSLSAKHNQISAIEPLTGMRNLEELFLMGNRLSDISSLSPLDSLKILDLDENILRGTLRVRTLTNLRTLSLVKNRLECYWELEVFPRIRMVVKGDLDELQYLTKLNVLYLDENRISELPDLTELENLTKITLDKNFNTRNRRALSEIAPLAALPNLRHVSARHNSISDIWCFNENMLLETLNLDTNSVSDLTPLAKCFSMRYLSLEGNRIEDIAVLLGNPGIGYGTQINLRDNPLSGTAKHEHIAILRNRGVNVRWYTTPDSE